MNIPECWRNLFTNTNWRNVSGNQSEPIWVRFNNGQAHKTMSPITLARWMADSGAVIIEDPTHEAAAQS